jgi:hypothetical protein
MHCDFNTPGTITRAKQGKPYAPPVSGTEPRSARVGAILGRPVNAAAV